MKPWVLRENDTYTLTTLPKGKTAVGVRWVYAVKSKADESETYKARYVAKGYNQVARIDYKKTLSNFEYDINTYLMTFNTIRWMSRQLV